MEISGKTKIMFILADPGGAYPGQRRADPRIARARPRHRHLAAACEAGRSRRAVEAIRAFQNVVGFGITIPHKIAVARFIDELLPQAKLVGSVNFVRRDPTAG